MNKDVVAKKVYTERSNHRGYYRYYALNGYSLYPNEIFLGRCGKPGNDPTETDIPSPPDRIQFRCCFTYYKKESVAMWALYAPKGVCLRYTNKAVELSERQIAKVELQLEESRIEIPLDCIKVFTKDVIYFGEEKKGYVLIRGTHRAGCSKLDLRELRKIAPVKSSAWAYETESRLYVSVPRDVLKRNSISEQEDLSLIITLQKDIVKDIHCFKSPLLECCSSQEAKQLASVHDKPIETSSLKGKVNLEKCTIISFAKDAK